MCMLYRLGMTAWQQQEGATWFVAQQSSIMLLQQGARKHAYMQRLCYFFTYGTCL